MNYFFKNVIWAFLIASAFSTYAQHSNKGVFDISETERKIDSLFGDYENEPGISIGIVFGDSLIFQRQYGLANLEYNIPITDKTSFHVASVSKQFTAFAILLLERDGKLSLEDDIRKYIPEMKVKNKKISIQNLLNHTSGLKDQWNLLRLAGWRLDDMISNEQVLNLIYNQQSLNFSPNDDFMYCNSGYTLLAEIVSRVSGMSFAEFAQQRIFAPIGMNNTAFVDQEGMVIPHRALSYYKEGNVYREDMFNNTSIGATNLSTTIEDLSKWALNFNKPKAGTNEIFAKMAELHYLNNGEKINYGYGQVIDTYKGVPRISHSGLDASYQAYIGRFPQQQISLLLVSNNSSINGGRTVQQLTEICLKGHLNMAPGKNNEKERIPKSPVKLSNKDLKIYQGHYWNKKDRYSRQIVFENDTLYYARENGNKTGLVPVGHSSFEMTGDEYISVAFKDNDLTLMFDDGYTIEFQKYVPANHNSGSLSEFNGIYFSKELNTFYSFNVKDGQLIANHQRLGDFKLKPIMKNYFLGSGSFREINFTRDSMGKIIGFEVSSSRAKNILFEKIKE